MRKQRFAISTFYGTYKLPWQPEFLPDLNKNNSFGSPPVDALCQISKVVASQLKSSENVDGRTTDAYPISSPLSQVSLLYTMPSVQSATVTSMNR